MKHRTKKHRNFCGAFSLFRHTAQHVFDEDAVAAGGVAHQNVGHRADELSVLENGASAHADVK